jgi:hypothetical protein
MSRRIDTGLPRVKTAFLGSDGEVEKSVAATSGEDYLGRLVKYIPAEIVGLFLASRGIVLRPSAGDDTDPALWIIAFICWILVPIFFWIATSRGGNRPLLLQILLATIAFPVWVLAVGGPPTSSLLWLTHHQYIGSVLLLFTTTAFARLKPPPGV